MHEVLYTDEARKRIQRYDRKLRNRIKEAIEKLAFNPLIGKALTRELKGRWSYRVSDLRIIYRILHEQVIILILTVGHRREVYEKQARK